MINKSIDPAVIDEYKMLRSVRDYSKAKKLLEKESDMHAKKIYNEIVDIAKKNNPNIKLREQLSKYGRKDYYEAFAEIFMNSQCGKQNELGKAMNIFLERRGLV